MKVLITGATGFLGRELIKCLLDKKDVSIVACGRTESKLADLKKDFGEHDIQFFCGDITNPLFLENTFFETRPTHVIHAAAMKRIDTCQDNPMEACRVNVTGTENVVRECKKHNADMVFVSTDKACKPCTTYGATKYLAEQLVRRESEHSKTFTACAVRYGNVFDSTGSVFCAWRKMFKETGKVMVRNKNMTRFYWTVNEAANFIIKKFDSFKKGAIYIPDINALNIYETACFLYGKENVFIGGTEHNEKIHEEMAEGIVSKDFVLPALVLVEDLNLGPEK